MSDSCTACLGKAKLLCDMRARHHAATHAATPIVRAVGALYGANRSLRTNVSSLAIAVSTADQPMAACAYEIWVVS